MSGKHQDKLLTLNPEHAIFLEGVSLPCRDASSSRLLWVGSLPSGMTASELTDVFSAFGRPRVHMGRRPDGKPACTKFTCKSSCNSHSLCRTVMLPEALDGTHTLNGT